MSYLGFTLQQLKNLLSGIEEAKQQKIIDFVAEALKKSYFNGLNAERRNGDRYRAKRNLNKRFPNWGSSSKWTKMVAKR
jgi:hypothetical protein